MLNANSIAGALYKNKFESSETPMGTGLVSTAASTAGKRWPNQKGLQISSDLGEISAVTVRLRVGYLPPDCSMHISVRCSAVTKTESATWCLLSYNDNDKPIKKIKIVL